MSEIETPADRLRAAAIRVRGGWRRGVLVDERGQRCAIGAILNAQADVHRTSQAEAAVLADSTASKAAAALHWHLSTTDGEHRDRMFFAHWRVVDDIEEWNDGSEMTGVHVAEVMEKAAAAWEENPDAAR
jgi:hypothetical protein